MKHVTYFSIFFQGWFGIECDKRCENGTFDDELQFCFCDECYTGIACDVICSGNGECLNNGTHKRCDCNTLLIGKPRTRPSSMIAILECITVEVDISENNLFHKTFRYFSPSHKYSFHLVIIFSRILKSCKI